MKRSRICQRFSNTLSDPENEGDRGGAAVGKECCQKGGTIKMGPSQLRKKSVKGCSLPKCNGQVEFKAVNEQKLGRTETVAEWEQVRGRRGSV